MFVTFVAARQAVLLAVYRHIYTSDRQEYFSVDEIREYVDVSIGKVFLQRALRSLVDNEFVETADHDDGYYYTLTHQGWEQAEKAAAALSRSDDAVIEGVPASDRVVSIDDNQRAEFQSDLESLASELSSSNEVGSEISEDRDRLAQEIQAGSTLLKARFVRLGALIGALAVPLRFLAEKFSGSAVGELAKKLLEELWKAMNL